MKLLISAGEASGDLLASLLATALKKADPKTEVWALGGQRLKAVSDHFIADLAGHGIMGWLEPITKLPYIFKLLADFKQLCKSERFDGFIPVDYYGLNIHFAKAAKLADIPVFYYVSPQVWASRSYRAKKLAKWTDKVLCLFPFETDFYADYGVAARFVGHPLAKTLGAYVTDVANDATRLIGLMPGSRPSEIVRHSDVLLRSWALIRAVNPQARAILFTRAQMRHLYPEEQRLMMMGITTCEGPAYAQRTRLSLCLTASGMSTLENMILGVPMVIFYSIAPAWLFPLLRFAVKTRFFGMPNILAGERIVDESAWGANARADTEAAAWIAAAANRLLADPARLTAQRRALLKIAATLQAGAQQPEDVAAREILQAIAYEKKPS
ncbi:MAG: hypothetical protein AABZ44_01535 [Elusimicrobiota bacterium]